MAFPIRGTDFVEHAKKNSQVRNLSSSYQAKTPTIGECPPSLGSSPHLEIPRVIKKVFHLFLALYLLALA